MILSNERHVDYKWTVIGLHLISLVPLTRVATLVLIHVFRVVILRPPWFCNIEIVNCFFPVSDFVDSGMGIGHTT